MGCQKYYTKGKAGVRILTGDPSLEGKDAVHEGLINEVGGLKDALNKLHEMINERNKKKNENV